VVLRDRLADWRARLRASVPAWLGHDIPVKAPEPEEELLIYTTAEEIK
jgi:hypothetical protein